METMPETHSKSGSHRLPAGREDWWSEDATATLIEAWGDRYVNLNRGNLRQNDWKDVADAVNSSHENGRRPKTDVQCKNRIDTLKKKYKTEKTKPSSSWSFFEKLDFLIGPVLKKSSSSAAAAAGGVVKSALRNPKSTESSLDGEEEEDEDDDDCGFVVKKHPRVEEDEEGSSSSCRELARAILKLGEAYERIESRKQKKMIELEKQRMELAMEVDLQRMNMLMEMQLLLEKSKLGKRKKL